MKKIVVFFLLVSIHEVSAASINQITWLIQVPSAKILPENVYDAGIFFDNMILNDTGKSETISGGLVSYGFGDWSEAGVSFLLRELDRYCFKVSLKGKILSERTYLPGLAVGYTHPFLSKNNAAFFQIYDVETSNAFYVVASKGFDINTVKLRFHLGYGDAPFLGSEASFSVMRGIFTGIEVEPLKHFVIMVEQDSHNLNAGMRFSLAPGPIFQISFDNLLKNSSDSAHAMAISLSASFSYNLMEGRLVELADEMAKVMSQVQKSAGRKNKEETTKGKESIERYTVVKGDTLPGIAGKQEIYNDPMKWRVIYDANNDQMSDPFKLTEGQVLIIPK